MRILAIPILGVCLVIVSAGCADQSSQHRPQPAASPVSAAGSAQLTLEGPRTVKVGDLCRLKVTFVNDTKAPLWCRVPASTTYEGPMGFQPDGKHISPARRTVLHEGLACSLIIAPRPRAVRGGAVRRSFGSSRSGWVRLEPGEQRHEEVYFDGNVLQGDVKDGPVWAQLGDHLLRVSLDYRTEADAPAQTALSNPLSVRITKL